MAKIIKKLVGVGVERITRLAVMKSGSVKMSSGTAVKNPSKNASF